ncbi:MAG TPA: hypothetical protein VG755_17755, partial [Nannocystaceae bacterium]|nr:hypothetical protein [Nannocystaceae bacterium]
ELDEEIRNLYEALEAAADDGQSSAANSPQWSAAPQPAPFAPQPAPFAAAPSPFAAAPAPFAPQPAAFEAAAPTSFPAASQSSMDYSSSSDDDVGGSKTPIIVAAIVAVLAIGGAGAWYTTRGSAEPPKPTAPVGEAKVIGAGEIPADTQDPNVAKGGDASRTPAQVIKERAEQPDRRPSSRPSSSSGPSRPREPDKPTRGPIKVGSSDDPLAGVK